MSKYILINGDKANFIPSFGAAPVAVQPGTIQGSGPATLNGEKLCVAGDEDSVSVNACTYTTPSHSIAGTGTLEINSLNGDQTAQKTQSGEKKVLLVGSTFNATFVVQTPAQQPTAAGPVPDAMLRYVGTGTFTTTNITFKGV